MARLPQSHIPEPRIDGPSEFIVGETAYVPNWVRGGRPVHIDPASHIYQDHRMTEARKLWGTKTLNEELIDLMENGIPNDGSPDLRQPAIKGTREKWLRVLEQDPDELLTGVVAEALGRDKDPVVPVRDIIETMSTEDFYSLVRSHVALHKKESAAMAERFVDYERNFRDTLNRFAGRVHLPPVVVNHRLTHLTTRPMDVIEAANHGINGQYSTDTGAVDMRTHLPEAQERTTYFHERLHALSGRTVLLKPRSEQFAVQKSGLRVADRFMWLNEAVTTDLANEMTGFETGAYLKERLLTELFLTKGRYKIDPQLALDAYFEDYDPAAQPKIPAWKKFRHAINEAWAPTFLVELDDIVAAEGVHAGIDHVRRAAHNRRSKIGRLLINRDK